MPSSISLDSHSEPTLVTLYKLSSVKCHKAHSTRSTAYPARHSLFPIGACTTNIDSPRESSRRGATKFAIGLPALIPYPLPSKYGLLTYVSALFRHLRLVWSDYVYSWNRMLLVMPIVAFEVCSRL